MVDVQFPFASIPSLMIFSWISFCRNDHQVTKCEMLVYLGVYMNVSNLVEPYLLLVNVAVRGKRYSNQKVVQFSKVERIFNY